MVKFVDGQIDVLVSTAIVESGLDIPASNTIIINRADRFGLAQLYQLRGRVGRERQQAYAYLLMPADGRLDETAQRRLRVIEEMTELGAGFRLAMRDLEIRGIGQPARRGPARAHRGGRVRSLLEAPRRRPCSELEGRASRRARRPVISADVEALLPEAYVPEVNQRLALYKRLAEIERPEDVSRCPRGAGRSLRSAAARGGGAARRGRRCAWPRRGLGVERIEARGGRAVLTFAPSTPVTPGADAQDDREPAAVL